MARSFYRVFFVLKEDTQGYGADGRAPLGRCVIEARGGTGKVTVYVQDLKPLVPYKATLIKRGEDKSYGVCLGGIEVGANKRAEARFDINPDNVNGQGFAIEEFDTVAITHNNGRVAIPLSGGSGGDGRWRGNFVMEAKGGKQEEREQILERIPEQIQKEIPEPEIVMPEPIPEAPEVPVPEPVEAPATETQEIQITEISEEPSSEPVMPFIRLVDHSELTAEGEVAAAEAENGGDSGDDTIESHHAAFKEIVQRFNRELGELAEMTAITEPVHPPEERISPFGSDDTNAWKQINMQDLALLPINLFDYEQKAVMSSAFYQHGPLIIAEKADDAENKYILGVPGVFTPEDSRGFRRLGFYTFRGKNGASGPGAEGYWLKEI